MHYPSRSHTRELPESEYKEQFDRHLSLLAGHGIVDIEVMFGWAWGNAYRNWVPFPVKLVEIRKEIELAEKSTQGKFREDDVYLIIPSREMELIFCHESDIHLNFRDDNDLTRVILDHWSKTGLTRSSEKKR